MQSVGSSVPYPLSPLAFLAVAVSRVRMTLNELPYLRKLSAVKNDAEFRSSLLLGVPKILPNSVSEPTFTSSNAGPQLKWPTYAPIDADTGCVTGVKSVSVTCTPTLCKVAIYFFLSVVLYYKLIIIRKIQSIDIYKKSLLQRIPLRHLSNLAFIVDHATCFF